MKDKKTLENWLNSRSLGDCLVVSERAALRLLPLWFESMNPTMHKKTELAVLPVLRYLLISRLIRNSPTTSVLAAATAAYVDTTYFTDASSLIAHIIADNEFVDIGEVARLAAEAVDSTCGTYVSLMAIRDGYSAENAARAEYSAAHNSASAWTQVRNDCIKLVDNINLDFVGLLDGAGYILQPDWEANRSWWQGPYVASNFWQRWYQGLLDGSPLDFKLLHDISLISNGDWREGQFRVAKRIAEIEKENSDHVNDILDLDSSLSYLSAAAHGSIKTTQQALIANREALPPTFDALVGYIVLEVARLQSLNYVSDEHRDDCHRQIRVLLTINSAVNRLREIIALPTTENEEVAQVEKLGRLYVKLFQDWPRSNAPDLVDSTCRAAVVGVSTVMLTMIGVPATAAVTVGAVMFGGKKLVDGVKAAKDAIGLSKPA